jgi:hypothetical protein
MWFTPPPGTTAYVTPVDLNEKFTAFFAVAMVMSPRIEFGLVESGDQRCPTWSFAEGSRQSAGLGGLSALGRHTAIRDNR